MGPQDASDRIWLKQSVQFTVAGQVRTIEIALPVRPGASAEEIERLLRQADAGLDQMTQHLTNKVNALLDQDKNQTPSAAPVPRRGSRVQDVPEPGASVATGRAGPPAPSTGPTAAPAGAGSEDASWGSARAADAVSSAGPPMDRKQFIAEIAVLGLNPNTAMKRLGLHTLEGVNLRQALEQLRQQLLHERPASSGGLAAQAEDADGSGAGNYPAKGVPAPSGSPRRPAPELKHASLLSQVAPAERPLLRTAPENDLVLEEEEPPAVEAPAEQAEQRRGLERAPIPIRGRTLRSLQEQVQAQTLLERLRRIKGRLNPPSSGNLKAFRNVVEGQIGAEKTAELVQAVWNVATPERLSPDQVAECIRWGKDDHFEDEVDMLLKLTASEES